MTKVSGAIIAIPILYVFMNKMLLLYKEDKTKFLKLLLVIVLFGIISLPIGLWHPIRNKVLFDQPLGGVLIPGSFQYIGDYSEIQRFFTLSIKETFKEIYCQIPGDYNVMANIIKTSIFGEFSYVDMTASFATLFKMVNTIVIIFTIIAIFMELGKPTKSKEKILLINTCLIFYFVLMLSYIYFNIQYPYSYTMNFRYIVPTVFIGALILLNRIENIKSETVKQIVENTIVIFCMLSIVMFFYI